MKEQLKMIMANMFEDKRTQRWKNIKFLKSSIESKLVQQFKPKACIDRNNHHVGTITCSTWLSSNHLKLWKLNLEIEGENAL